MKYTDLSESEIGDLIWGRFDDFYLSLSDNESCFREFAIGNGRVDFAVFTPDFDGELEIQIFELKIFAGYESVTQVSRYLCDLKAYCWATLGYIPNIIPKIFAFDFDPRVIDICVAANIKREKIYFDEEGLLQSDPIFTLQQRNKTIIPDLHPTKAALREYFIKGKAK